VVEKLLLEGLECCLRLISEMTYNVLSGTLNVDLFALCS